MLLIPYSICTGWQSHLIISRHGCHTGIGSDSTNVSRVGQREREKEKTHTQWQVQVVGTKCTAMAQAAWLAFSQRLNTESLHLMMMMGFTVFFFPSLSFFFCVFFIYLYLKRWMDGTITLLLGTKSFVATVESGVSGGIYNVPFIWGRFLTKWMLPSFQNKSYVWT